MICTPHPIFCGW